MILNLYKVTDGDNVINKNKGTPLSININLRKDFNIHNPSLIISDDGTIGITGFNYCELPELNRFYFINYVEGMNSKLYRLECSTDLIETFKSDVLNSNARFYRKIKIGDYQNGQIDLGVTKSIEKIFSDATIESNVSSMLLTTIEDRG